MLAQPPTHHAGFAQHIYIDTLSPVNVNNQLIMATSSQPPPYTATGPPQKTTTTDSLLNDDQLWALRGYDIVYIVDDSTSMSWTEKRSGIVPWPHARDALMTFSTICAEWDEDGQDVWFLNRAEPVLNATPQQIADAFNLKNPVGGTNMGRKLAQIASKYFEQYVPGVTKPLNILAITDGQFSDDVTSVIIWIVQQLDRRNALPNQIGIQFVQIGADPEAKRCLEALDDDLENAGLSRDIVDTVPWIPKKVDGPQFDGRYLVKVVCGAINKRLDKQNVLGGQVRKVPARSPSGAPQRKASKLKRFFGAK